MIERGRIGVRQFTVLTILFTIGSSILIVPAGLAEVAKTDAWIAAIVGLVGGLLLVQLCNLIAARFPRMTLVQIIHEVFGQWLGKAIAFLYFVYFYLMAALVLRNISDFLTTHVLVNTPIQMIHIFFLLVVILGLRNGLETFTRTAEIFLPWVMLFFVIMIVLLPPNFEPKNALPVFGYGIKPIVQASLPHIGTPYMELVVFLMILPFVKQSRKARRAFFVGVFIGGMMLVIISLLSILVLGADVTARQLYPSYSLAKKISIGNFLERLEVIMAGIWFITIYFKLVICFYASTMIFSEMFRFKTAKPLYLPFGMIMIVLSIIVYPNVSYFMNFASKTYLPYAVTYAVIIPAALLLVAMIRKKKQAFSE
jgi:spore germination protein KB